MRRVPNYKLFSGVPVLLQCLSACFATLLSSSLLVFASTSQFARVPVFLPVSPEHQFASAPLHLTKRIVMFVSIITNYVYN